MKQIAVHRTDNHHPASSRYLTAAVAAVLVGATRMALADTTPTPTAPAETIEEVVVTGIRHSIQQAVEEKRQDLSIVEIVTQEDIGKLPDPSVAESISRLSGVAGQRVNGRVQDISVRGFSGDYVTTLLNGREQASTGDNRAVEFDQYPAEIVESVVVYKTTAAERLSQGLAATINLRTVRPLSVANDTFAVGLRGEKNSLGALNPESTDKGYRFNATWIKKFYDNKLGVAVGYARLDSPEQEQHYKAWWFGNDGPSVGGTNALNLDGAELYAYSRKDVRDGLVGVVEYKPNEKLHSTTDLYYSKYKQTTWDRGWETYLCPCATGNPVANPTVSNVGGLNFVTAGTYNGVQSILLNQYQSRDDKLYAIGENLELDIGGWKTAGDLSYSYADRKEQWVEGYAGYGPIPTKDNVTVTNAASQLPSISWGLNYADATKMQLGDPAAWGGWGHDGTMHNPDVTDKIKSVRLTADHDLGGPFTTIHFGAQYQQRDKIKSVDEYNLFLPNNRTPITVPANLLESPVNLGFGGGGSVLAYNLMGAVGSVYALSPIVDSNHYDKNWSVTEKLTSAFAQADIKTHLGSVPVAGNVGVQFIHTNQSSTGFDQVPGTSPIVTSLVTEGTSYNDVLPSLNLVFDLDHDMLLRASAGKQMVRPRMQDLRGSFTASYDVITQQWSGSGGNPQLRPWRAWAYDMVWEKYFAKNSYFSVGGWYKEITTFDYNTPSTQPFDFHGFNANGLNVTNWTGYVSAPHYAYGGSARGVEAALSLEAGLLWDKLDGFGAQFAMGWSESSVAPDSNLGPTLPGLSKQVRSMTLYYEKQGFQARVSERYRSSFLGSVEQLFANRVYSQIQDDRQLDASIGYTFGSGPVKNLSIMLLGQNLRNSPYRDANGSFSNGSTTPQTYELYGRTYLLGVSYKL